MDSKEIQERVDALVKAMLAKGMERPEAQFVIISNQDMRVHIDWGGGDIKNEWKVIFGVPSESLDDADAFIAEQPNPEQRKLVDFMRLTAAAIDYGKKHNIDTDFLNPLVKTMERLSENAITDQRAA